MGCLYYYLSYVYWAMGLGLIGCGLWAAFGWYALVGNGPNHSDSFGQVVVGVCAIILGVLWMRFARKPIKRLQLRLREGGSSSREGVAISSRATQVYVTSDWKATHIYPTRDSNAWHMYITSDWNAMHVYITSDRNTAQAYIVNPEALPDA